jgi:microcystin-dependent protein
MGTPYMGELMLVSFNFAPRGWALCNGQFLPINQNQALFSLLGTMYGGDGRTTFALPDLRGRVPMHVGNGWVQGARLGEETHALSQSEMPAHVHLLQASRSDADSAVPAGGVLAAANNAYAPAGAGLTALRPESVTNVGGSQAHDNHHPYLTLNWCVALQGVFPSRN